MWLPALLAAAAVPVGPAAEPTTFELRDSFGGQVDGGGFVYVRHRSSRDMIQRYDLATARTTTLWTAAREQDSVPAIDVANGRIAFEVRPQFQRSRVLLIDVASGAVSELDRGRYDDRRDCGSSVQLEDVASSGDVLVTKATVPCGRRAGRLVVQAYGPVETRTLLTRSTRSPFLSDGPPHRRLAGDHLLTFGDRVARVRNVATGEVRQLRPLNPASGFGPLAVAPNGRVLLDEFTFVRRGTPRQTIRLLSPSERGREGTVVHRSRRAFGEAHFCGDRAVMHTVGPGRRRELKLLDPPGQLFSGVIPEPDTTSSCDAGQFAVTVSLGGGPDRTYLHTLP